MAPYKILKQGYIEKEPPVSKRGLRKKLVRYWFVLVEDKKQVALVYFKNEDHYIARQRNEGFIRIDEAMSISVVSDYMGRKHAFVIKTPKGEYTLAPESRYDLHEWLFTLHNALEVFKKKKEKLKQRQGMRQRANTLDSDTIRSLDQQGATAGTHRTPPHTPTRRAPPPPTGHGSNQRRRPNRPAPGPPASRPHNGDIPQHNEPVYPADEETPPPSYTESNIVMMSQDTPHSHEVMDLDISHVDQDVHESLPENGAPPLDDGGPYPLNESSPLAERSNLMQQTSSSMPELLNIDEDTPTTTPDEEHLNEREQEEDSPPESHESSIGAQFHIRHTRHHSLTFTEIKLKKKRSSRRQNSLKLRSRSPPELPPPPPPEGETPASPASLGEPPQANGLPRNEASTASLGFSGVMNTISDIEHQIDEMSDEFSPKPTIPAPVRESSGEAATFQFSAVRTPSPVPEQQERDEFNEDEWLCDYPPHPLPSRPHPPLMDEVRQGVLASPENAQVETVSIASHHQRKGKQVMFKEEVEDIPITYEPVADGNDSEEEVEEEVIPFSVAELKKRLFGAQEAEATRYKKEGPLSPKHTHPLNATFNEFSVQSSRERSPNANNNNSGGESEMVRSIASVDEGNLYERPWDLKSVSTPKQEPQKEPTPPPVAPKQEPQKEPTPPPVAPKPVTSPLHSKQNGTSVLSDHANSVSQNESSLLSSISSTLQETSKYGSDSFLSNYDPAPKKKQDVRFSSKGELEKIRAEHRRDPPPPPQGASPHNGHSPLASHSPLGASPQGVYPKLDGSSQACKKKRPSPNHQKMNGASPSRSVFVAPRNAASLDTLRDTKPSTQVTYDANTNSHIFRSLV